jgi:nucleoid DNA-binding protein
MNENHVAKQNSEEPSAVVPHARICGSTGGVIPGATQPKAESAKPLTKTEIIANIVAATALPKKDVVAVFDALTEEITKSFGKKGAKAFVLPGLIKIDLKQVKAQPAKKGIKNPLTGDTYDRPAKPAHKKIRVRALKALKEMA